jgi:hypothetical protein
MLKHSKNIITCRYIPVIEKTELSNKVSEYIKDFLEDNPQHSGISLQEMSKEPWLHDPDLTDEERMYWKIKDQCHVCRIPPRFHRDDCPWSHNQLMFAELEKVDRHHLHIDLAIGGILKNFKKNV